MSKPVFDDLFEFSGRRNRQSYLLYLICFTIALVVVWGVAAALGLHGEWSILIVAALISLAMCLSGWAVAAQRCRDFGWTGWAVLITIIPYIGWIFALAILFIPGNVGTNRYGPDPLGTAVQR